MKVEDAREAVKENAHCPPELQEAKEKLYCAGREQGLCYNTAFILPLGVRYSTSLLAISANRLARSPPHQQNNGAPLRGAHPLFLLGGVLLSDLR